MITLGIHRQLPELLERQLVDNLLTSQDMDGWDTLRTAVSDLDEPEQVGITAALKARNIKNNSAVARHREAAGISDSNYVIRRHSSLEMEPLLRWCVVGAQRQNAARQEQQEYKARDRKRAPHNT